MNKNQESFVWIYSSASVISFSPIRSSHHGVVDPQMWHQVHKERGHMGPVSLCTGRNPILRSALRSHRYTGCTATREGWGDTRVPCLGTWRTMEVWFLEEVHGGIGTTPKLKVSVRPHYISMMITMIVGGVTAM